MATTARSDRSTNQMQAFTWTGTDKRGIVMKGEELAKNAALLRAELRRRGITPKKVDVKRKPLFGAAGSKISSREIAFFSRQMATMMRSGVPIVSTLEIIAEGHKNPRMTTMLNDVKSELQGGSSLYESISKHPVQFDDLYRNLVKAGEGAGVLETVLATIADYKEKTESLKGKIKKALFYPIMVIFMAIIVSAVLLVYVVPQFQDIFKSFGTDLPAFTQMLVTMSDLLVSKGIFVVIGLAALVAGFIYTYKRSAPLRHAIDKYSLKIPVVGDILNKSAIARFARSLAVTFKAGVPLVEALGIVAGATGNRVYETAVERIRDDVSVGYAVNMAMKQVDVFPHMVVQMTAIGEEAGALDDMLFKVAEYYEEEVDNAVDSLASLLEPLIMVVIGVIVGSIVIGMYLPIFKLASVVG